MTEVTGLTLILSVLVTCRDLDEVAETWRSNQDGIKALPPHDFAALIVAKDLIKHHFDTLLPEELDTWVADFMAGQNAENAAGRAKIGPMPAGHAPGAASANTSLQGRQGAVK